jgi:hypothetical protein
MNEQHLRNTTRAFRRDPVVSFPAGTAIAEFASAWDALDFARSKGDYYVVTAGMSMLFAVRKAIPESALLPHGDTL